MIFINQVNVKNSPDGLMVGFSIALHCVRFLASKQWTGGWF